MQHVRQQLRLPILREKTKGCLCAGAIVVLLAFEMLPTALEVWSSPFVREQLSGDSWIPGKQSLDAHLLLFGKSSHHNLSNLNTI
jgi:hypothetical protein